MKYMGRNRRFDVLAHKTGITRRSVESQELLIGPRRLARILGTDALAIIQTNLAAEIGLQPDRIRRY